MSEPDYSRIGNRSLDDVFSEYLILQGKAENAKLDLLLALKETAARSNLAHFARLIGCSPPYLSNVFNNKISISHEKLSEVAEVIINR